MTIQDWGAIGEVVGAAAVVASLIYLAVQIRQNTLQLRANSYDLTADHVIRLQHLWAMDNESAHIYLTERGALFETAIAHANALAPAFVVICGDLVNRVGHAGQIAEFLRIGSLLDPSIPLYFVAGNHDVGNAPTAESQRAYRETFGADPPETEPAAGRLQLKHAVNQLHASRRKPHGITQRQISKPRAETSGQIAVAKRSQLCVVV